MNWRKDMKYKAPLEGYYTVSAKIFTATPTGEFEEVPNPEYRWFTFWLPKTITREKILFEENDLGSQIKYLKKDEEVFSKHAIVRIGG